MLSISKSQQLLIAVVLMLLMIVTRGQHFASINALPSASWAVFFLAGLYLSRPFWFPVLLLLAAALDFAAITWAGVSSYCVSPAYGFLVPAYGALWLAGRWYAQQHQFAWTTILPLAFSVAAAAAVATTFSSGGFYFFSGRYVDPTLAEFGLRFVKYFPKYLSSLSFYVAIAAIVHIAFHFSRFGQQANQQP